MPRWAPDERRIVSPDQILRLLPATYPELMEKLGVKRQVIEYWLRKMKRLGLCHRGKYERSPRQGAFMPVFFDGPGKDARCQYKPFPKGTTQEQRKQTRRKRQSDAPRPASTRKATPFDALLQ